MFLNKGSAFRSRFNTWRFPALVVFVNLLAGCATPAMLPSIAGGESEAQPINTQGPKSSYNKPYRVKGRSYSPMLNASGYRATGLASWYGAESGNRTASGVRFDPDGLTAAHKTLPIPSKVRVTNLKNGRYVDVIINDRGPFKSNRLIDLSRGAAKQIGLHGVTEVSIEYLEG